jgi:uncharacterized membrane protein
VNFLQAGVTGTRSRMGLLFLALIILVIFDDEMKVPKRQVLFLTFLTSMILAYYTISYLFVFLALCVVLLSAMSRLKRSGSKRFRREQIFSLSVLVLSAALVYLWWGLLTQGSFNDLSSALIRSFESLVQVANVEARSPVEQKVYATGLQGPGDVLNLFTYYATVALAAVGVAFSAVKPKETKFEDEYRFLLIGCLVLWILAVAMPGLSHIISIENMFAYTLIILLPCIPLGAVAIVRVLSLLRTALKRIEPTAFRRHANPFLRAFSRRLEPVQAIIVVLLILTILSNTGVSYQLFGQPQAALLNSQGQQYDQWYVHPQEIVSAGWLSTHAQQGDVFSDSYGITPLAIGSLLQPSSGQSLTWFPVPKWNFTTPAYLYLRYENVVDHTAILSSGTYLNSSQPFTPVPTSLPGDKIYSNGGSDIYLRS